MSKKEEAGGRDATAAAAQQGHACRVQSRAALASPFQLRRGGAGPALLRWNQLQNLRRVRSSSVGASPAGRKEHRSMDARQGAASQKDHGGVSVPVLNREDFTKLLKLKAILVPAAASQKASAVLKGLCFDKPRLRHIIPDPQKPSLRRVILDENIRGLEDIPEERTEKLRELMGLPQGSSLEGSVVDHEQVLEYSYWPADHILRGLLPPGTEVPAAYETVGHVAHVNIRDELLPFRFLIGQVLLDKSKPRIRVVVNKQGSIENEFRVPHWEILARLGPDGETLMGRRREDSSENSVPPETARTQQEAEPVMPEAGALKEGSLLDAQRDQSGAVREETDNDDPELETSVKQHGALFTLHFGKVYWNSRLEHEHKRLVDLFACGQVVLDLFAGVGPFAVPAAMKGCRVYANDLNPDSVHYLTRNCRQNRVNHLVTAFNMDAREFVPALLSGQAKLNESGPAGNPPVPAAPREQDRSPNEAGSEGAATAVAGGDTGMSEVIEGAPGLGESEGSRSKRKRGGKGRPAAPKEAAPVFPAPSTHFDHAVLNLPASALHFVDCFKAVLDPDAWAGPMPWIHVYTFKKSKQTVEELWGQVEEGLGLPQGGISERRVHVVRDVAPNKEMLCMSFQLPESAAFAQAPGKDSLT